MKIKDIFILTIILFIFVMMVSPNIYADISSLSQNITINTNGGNHLPIYIDGNDGFTYENGVTGGSGTKSDPYIIEDWIIESNGSTSDGIFIKNTDMYFELRNCTTHHFNIWLSSGITFNNVTNGRIDNTSSYANCYGILIVDSSDIEITHCFLYNIDYQGLTCWKSSNIWIYSCEFYYVDEVSGIELSDSSDIVIENTYLHDSFKGIITSESYDTQNPLMNITIKNCKLYNHSWDGIHFSSRNYHSSYSVISNCEFYNNGWDALRSGVHIERLSHNIIENCTFYQNRIGISIQTKSNIIRNCNISNNKDGIQISGLLIPPIEPIPNNKIIHCDIFNNEKGLIQVTALKTYIEKNNIFNNSWFGLFIIPHCTAKVFHNNIYGNGFSEDWQYSCGLFCSRSIIDIRNNWWGAEDGPKYRINRGQGDKIIRFISIAFFRPWATEPIPDAGVQ